MYLKGQSAVDMLEYMCSKADRKLAFGSNEISTEPQSRRHSSSPLSLKFVGNKHSALKLSGLPLKWYSGKKCASRPPPICINIFGVLATRLKEREDGQRLLCPLLVLRLPTLTSKESVGERHIGLGEPQADCQVGESESYS